MSVHLYALEVAGELLRRLDVDGLERLRAVQIQYSADRLAADGLRWRKRKRALADADARYRDAITATLLDVAA